MIKEVLVPALGESVSEATVLSLHKKVGEYVVKDEVIAELETDKVTLEVYSVVNGVVTELLVKTGQGVKVGDLVAKIDESAAKPLPTTSNPAAESLSKAMNNTASGMPASPSAKKLAEEKSVPLADVEGTGKRGQVLREDVVSFSKQKVSIVATSVNQTERVKMSKLRQTIAKRLKDAQNTAAILTTFNEIDMLAVMNLRSQYKDAFEKKHGVKLGFMSLFAKAAVVALQEIPAINAEIQGDELVYKNFYNIGMAVGTPQGLVVPVVRNVENMSLAQIEKSISDYAVKAKDGKLALEDLQGGTFTISNGGVYGSLLSTPIINPPQSGILGLHNIVKRPVAIDDKVEIRPMMYVALSYDHRIVDGKEAVTFLVRIKQIIEDPSRLVLAI
jgi:2-oxoglutarate dehydrogenase E2 component (dihydrolipoamide succinyltransferase)